MRRLLLLADARLAMARSQTAAFLESAAAHPRFEVVAVVDANRAPPIGWRGGATGALARAAMRAFNPTQLLQLPSGSRLERTARRHGVPLVTPAGRDINAAAFVEALRDRWQADVALSLGCLQILRRPLLDCFEQAVNFHNGLLPDYRGLSATSWSLYHGEPRSGVSFHRMTEGIDAGAVLVEGSVPTDESSLALEVEAAKLELAASLAPAVLEAIDQRAPGRAPTPGAGRYFSGADGRAIRTIADPRALPMAEIERRLRCFTRLRIRLDDGRWWLVTGLRRQGKPSFATAEALAISRALYLPPTLYRLHQALSRRPAAD